MAKPSDRDPASPPPSAEAPPAAGFLRVLAAVFASFLGIRKKASGERDMVTIKPLHVIVAGLLGAAVFVAMLLMLVTMITRQS
jgi:Protein of unknown function (DUF2970)